MVPMMIILILMMMIGLLQLVHLRIAMMPKFGMTSYVKDVNWMMTTYVKDDDSDRTYISRMTNIILTDYYLLAKSSPKQLAQYGLSSLKVCDDISS